MLNNIIPENELKFIEDNFEKYQAAEERLTYLESFKNALKALLMMESHSPTVAGKEMTAYASEEYQIWCKDYAQAKSEFSALKLKIEVARMKCELWRSQEASNRMIDRTIR